MDATTFANQVHAEIETLELEKRSQLTVTEFVVQGRIHFSDTLFLAVYFNERSDKIGFALIHNAERIWGIDCDKTINWHRHPLRETTKHEPVSPQSIPEIISELKQVLIKIE